MDWRESENGIGDLMHCQARSIASGGLAEPGSVNVRWWAAKGIEVGPDPMGRAHLFALAAAARESGSDEALVELFWHVLAWGVVGNFRNAARIVSAAVADGEEARLLAALRPASEASYRGDIEAGYRAFVDHRISQFNYAFFSKFLYFTGDRSKPAPRCLILDDRVATALRTVTGRSYIPNSPARKPSAYVDYCRDVHRWSVLYGCDPDEIEWRLYRFGQLIGTRERWLRAEVSLYRDGQTPIGFDAIVSRVGNLDLLVRTGIKRTDDSEGYRDNSHQP